MPPELIIVDLQQLHYENELLNLTVLGGIRLEGLDRLRVTGVCEKTTIAV